MGAEATPVGGGDVADTLVDLMCPAGRRKHVTAPESMCVCLSFIFICIYIYIDV